MTRLDRSLAVFGSVMEALFAGVIALLLTAIVGASAIDAFRAIAG